MPAGAIPWLDWTDPQTGHHYNFELGERPPVPPDVLSRMPSDVQDYYRARQEFWNISSVRHPGAGTGPGWMDWSTGRIRPGAPTINQQTQPPVASPLASAPTAPVLAAPTSTPVAPRAPQSTPPISLATLLGQGQSAPPATIGRLPTGPSETQQSQPQQVSPLMQLFNFPRLRTKKPAQAAGGTAPIGVGNYNENFWNAWRI